jgi:hypothetical protein
VLRSCCRDAGRTEVPGEVGSTELSGVTHRRRGQPLGRLGRRVQRGLVVSVDLRDVGFNHLITIHGGDDPKTSRTGTVAIAPTPPGAGRVGACR